MHVGGKVFTFSLGGRSHFFLDDCSNHVFNQPNIVATNEHAYKSPQPKARIVVPQL